MSEHEYITDSVNVSSLFLPERGLQGEEIPSFILWYGDDLESINISYDAPLNFKEGFNAEIWNIEEKTVTVKNIEMNGYLGIVFNSEKIDEAEKEVTVNYVLKTNNGDLIEFKRNIILFKPILEIGKTPPVLRVNLERAYIRDRIKIKNIGIGTILLRINATDDSSIKTITPLNEKEFRERFEADFIEEIKGLQLEFPHYSDLLDEMSEWEGKLVMDLTKDERNRFTDYFTILTSTLGNDNDFFEGFVGAFLTVILKNIEIINSINRFIKMLESLVASDIIIINPFDVFVLEEGERELIIKISQTDRMYDDYDDIILDAIKIKSDSNGTIPVYQLFDWRR